MRVLIIMLVFLSGCGTCYDNNPRNMKNMTAEQLERELGDVQ